MSFDNLSLKVKTVAIPSQFDKPTEIQQAAIPKIVSEKMYLVLAQTGMEKHWLLAYLAKILTKIRINCKHWSSFQRAS